MDLSLLSDAEIRALDARIRELWAANLRCTPAAPGALTRAPKADELRVDPEGSAMRVSWNGEGIGYHFLNEPRHVKATPTSADEAWEAWRAALQRIFHEVHHWRVNGRAIGPYRIVCAGDKADDVWLARETLMPASRERLLHVCPRRVPDAV